MAQSSIFSPTQPPEAMFLTTDILKQLMADYRIRFEEADSILAEELVNEPEAIREAIRAKVRDVLINEWLDLAKSITTSRVAAALSPTLNNSTTGEAKVSVSTSTTEDAAQAEPQVATPKDGNLNRSSSGN